MDKLISEQAVLDAICKVCTVEVKPNECRYRKGLFGGCEKHEAIKAIPSTEQKWTPVSERLPEKGKQVLCCNKSGSVFTSAITYINDNGMVAFGQHYEVIAWMPLPQPYKAESED